MNAKNNRFKGTKGPEVMSLPFGAECLPLGKPRLLHGWVRSLLKRQKPFLRAPGMDKLKFKSHGGSMKKVGKWLLVIAVISVLSWDVVCFARSMDALEDISNGVQQAIDEQGVDFPVIRVGAEHWKIRQAVNKDFDGNVRPWSYMYSFSLKGAKKMGNRRLYVLPGGKLWQENQQSIQGLLKMAPGTHVEMERTTDGYKYVLAQNYKKGFYCLGVIEAPSGVKAFYVVEDCASANEMNKEMNKFIKIKLPSAQDFPKREFDGLKKKDVVYEDDNGKWKKAKK